MTIEEAIIFWEVTTFVLLIAIIIFACVNIELRKECNKLMKIRNCQLKTITRLSLENIKLKNDEKENYNQEF